MKNKQAEITLKILLIFIILQPFFDILSFLSIREIIPFNISTYIKPLFVFGIATYSLFFLNKKRKPWYLYIAGYILFMIGHFFILNRLLIPIGTILHEYRFLINIAYMIALFITFYSVYKNYKDKEELLRKLKKTIIITFCLYGILLLISVLSGTSALTYEYADKSKKGFKGWFDSGQIFGHAISISFPVILYTLLKPTRKWFEKIIPLALIIITVSLLGTKVPYYIVLIVLIIYLTLSLFLKLINHEHQFNILNIIILLVSIFSMVFTYKFTPVKYNSDLNNSVSKTSIDSYNKEDINGSKNSKKLNDLITQNKGKKDASALEKYYEWNVEASAYLDELYTAGKLHPSNMRAKQFFYSYHKYSLADFEYKLLGIGYLNQEDGLSIESDFFMSIFCFGILGFILFLIVPLIEFIKSTIFILKNLKKTDLELYALYIGLGIFFCISIYAGYTFIYTNFSIFLAALIIMIKSKRTLLQESFITQSNKKVSFLLLHLGYGGIESATINSANALSNKYDVELVSFYNLNNNQETKLNKNITIKYLYNGSPNRDEFISSVKNKNIISIFKEGFKALNILIKKKTLLTKYIKNCDAKYIVSTRVEFSSLLSDYGNSNSIKIAQEHHHHNNNQKYIRKLKNNYNRIDYLCALTTSLKEDYEKFLKDNKHTKIILLPNMLYDLPNKKTDLKNKNLISVSRLDEGKKIDEIIKIFSKINHENSNLYIIGDGKEFNKLKDLIKELKLTKKVHMLGYLNKEQIEKYMLKSSIFLMTSISEGLPMVLLEAMSYGVPCIAYETDSGTSDIIDNNKNGYIIKNRDESEYIEKINDLINNSKKLNEFSNNSIQKSKDFSKDEILKIWYKILQ